MSSRMDGGERIEITVLGGIGEVAAAEWDACAGDGAEPPVDPFTTHRFLQALEDSGSVGPGTGWMPRHLVVRAAGYDPVFKDFDRAFDEAGSISQPAPAAARIV